MLGAVDQTRNFVFAQEAASGRGTRHSARAASKRSLENERALQAAVAASAAAAASNESSARSKRRRAVDDKIEGMFHPTALEDLLNAMMKHRDGWPFDRPITKADAPDYHAIIKRPMDLGSIRSNIIRMKYNCNQVRPEEKPPLLPGRFLTFLIAVSCPR